MTKKEAAHVLKNCFALEPEIAQAAEMAIEVLEESEEREMRSKELQSEVEKVCRMAVRDLKARSEVVHKNKFQPGDKFILEIGEKRKYLNEYEIVGTDLYVDASILEKLPQMNPLKSEKENEDE